MCNAVAKGLNGEVMIQTHGRATTMVAVLTRAEDSNPVLRKLDYDGHGTSCDMEER